MWKKAENVFVIKSGKCCEKNYEIAEHVGYEDANYFGYVFKRKYGMSPSKYRTEHMGK